MKKLTIVFVALLTLVTLFTACGSGGTTETERATTTATSAPATTAATSEDVSMPTASDDTEDTTLNPNARDTTGDESSATGDTGVMP